MAKYPFSLKPVLLGLLTWFMVAVLSGAFAASLIYEKSFLKVISQLVRQVGYLSPLFGGLTLGAKSKDRMLLYAVVLSAAMWIITTAFDMNFLFGGGTLAMNAQGVYASPSSNPWFYIRQSIIKEAPYSLVVSPLLVALGVFIGQKLSGKKK